MVNAAYTQTLSLATRIKPELIAQELKAYPKMTDGFVGKEIFKRTKTIMDSHLIVNKETKTIKSIPYVSNTHKGVVRKNMTENDTLVTVPPMKENVRLDAATLKKMARLKGKDFMAWIRDEIVAQLSMDKDFSLEYLKRSTITSGNLSYPYLVGGQTGFDTVDLSLGTMVDGGTFTNKWGDAGTTISQIHSELAGLRRTASKTAGSTSYFASAANIKTWCPDAVFNAAFAKLESKQSIDVIPTKVIDEDNIMIGSYRLVRNAFEYVKPNAAETLTEAITAKQIRMVDISVRAPHTIAYLELDSVNAKNGSKHVLIQTIVDDYGDWVDVQLQMRPVPLLIPEATAKAIVLA